MTPTWWAEALDRELEVSAFCHDARGLLTAIDGFAELEGLPPSSQARVASGRLAQMVTALPARPEARRVVDLADHFPVASALVLTARIELLAAAVGAFPDATVRLASGDEPLVGLEIVGLERAELTVDWNTAVVRRWESGDLEGRAGARLRIAARLAAAARVQFQAPDGVAHGVLGIAFRRALG